MKGNAKRNGEARTRNINPDSLPMGPKVWFGMTEEERTKYKNDNPAFKTRCETKGQAKLRRSIKEYERSVKSPDFEKRTSSCNEFRRPGSLAL